MLIENYDPPTHINVSHTPANMTKRHANCFPTQNAAISFTAEPVTPALAQWVRTRFGVDVWQDQGDAGDRVHLKHVPPLECIYLAIGAIDAWIRSKDLAPQPHIGDDCLLLVPLGHLAEFYKTNTHHYDVTLAGDHVAECTSTDGTHDVRYAVSLSWGRGCAVCCARGCPEYRFLFYLSARDWLHSWRAAIDV